MEFENVICETPEQFRQECLKWAGKGVVRGRKLIAYGVTVAELVTSQRGGFREGAGRPKTLGTRHTWVVPEDIERIYKDKGICYIWDAVRFKVKSDLLGE